jgi:histidinol-phosphatase (PHP family)
MRANYHTHTSFCDGEASPSDMARAARAGGFDILGFSGHAPFPAGMPWAVQPEDLEAYAAEVRRLAAAWSPGGPEALAAGPMEILLGLEIDWFPPELRPSDGSFDALGLDFIIGSTHLVEFEGVKAFSVDGPVEDFAEGIRAAGGSPRVYREYYRRLAQMIVDGGFDILGHFDLVKKNNSGGRFFDEESPDYLGSALEAAGLLRGRDIVVEINTGAMARKKRGDPYPSLAILRELKAMGVRITLSADAHAPGHLAAHREEARALARAAGYRSLAVLSKGSWSECGIEEG